jgi:hypothetical protein
VLPPRVRLHFATVAAGLVVLAVTGHRVGFGRGDYVAGLIVKQVAS